MGCGWSSDGDIEHGDAIEQVKDGAGPSPYSLPSDSPATSKAITDQAPIPSPSPSPSPSPPTPSEPPRTTTKEQDDAIKISPTKTATIPPSKPVQQRQQQPQPQPQTLRRPTTPTIPDASPIVEANTTTTTRPSRGKDLSEFGKPPKPSIGDLLSKPKLVTHVRSTAVVVSPKQSKSTNVKKSSHHLKNVFATPLDLMGSLRAPVFPKDSTEKAFVQNALQTNFVFSTLGASELNTIIDAFERVEVLEGDTLIQQGDVGDYFYIIREGKVRFEVNGTKVGHAVTGKSFGELSLLYTSPRAASVIAEVHTSLYRVDQKTFRYIMQSQTLQTENDKKDLLKSVPFLKSLDPTDINKLIHTMVPRVFEPGEYLVRKGEVGDTFYVIQEGTISVTEIRIGSTNYEDQTLGPGDYFGERALVTKEPRAANCVGKTKGLVLCIDKETFEKAVGKFSVLTLKSEDCRKLSAIRLLKNTNLSQPSIIASLATQILEQQIQARSVFITEGQPTTAALYLIRSGRVDIKSQDGTFNNTVEPGGYFGEDMLELDVGGTKYGTQIVAKYTVTALDLEVCVGALTIEECRKIIDTTILGTGIQAEQTQTKNSRDTRIAFDSLTRHDILGVGTFGQVWLVSRDAPDGSRHPYALKIQSKYELLESKQAKGVVHEKNLMQRLHHPFLIELVDTYQDEHYLYMLLEIVQGGELLSLLHQANYDGISEKDAKFYAAGILEGLSYMHRRQILYRDLKPENVLIDSRGYPIIVDFGFAKYVIGKTYTLCGTPLYLAPEVILNRGHDKGADHWSYAVMLYEMIAGRTPFYIEGMDQITLFRNICEGEYQFPPAGVMTMESEDLLQRFFVLDPAKRLGSLARGLNEIYSHTWYADIDFTALRNRELPVPWLPEIKDPLDKSNFDDWGHLEDKTLMKGPTLSEVEQKVFEGF